MRIRRVLVLTGALALTAGSAAVHATDDGDDGLGQIRAAAAQARAAANELIDVEDADGDEDFQSALEALQAALDRLAANDDADSSVAARVLAALLAGESPEGIGAEHGAEMAQAASERRDEQAQLRASEAQRSDESVASDDAEPVRPEPVRPEPVRPEPVRPEPVRPDPAHSDDSRPGDPVRPSGAGRP